MAVTADTVAIDPALLDAYKEVTRVMLGFRTRDEMEDVICRPLVWAAVKRLGEALDEVRRRSQPDEFALGLAIELELLSRFSARGDNLESMFNDPDFHSLPDADLHERFAAAWTAAAPPAID